MSEDPAPYRVDPQPPAGTTVRGVELKAAFLLGLIGALVLAFIGYVLIARGTFEPTQTLVLVADDAEGVSVGSNLYFSGFAIGRVHNIALAPNGQARVQIEVAHKDAHWLRESSVFTLERGLVGSARLRVITATMDAPPLAEGAERPVLRGDASAEIPALVANARGLLENLQEITESGGDLRESLANLRATTEFLRQKLTGRHGALGLAFGNDADAQQVVDALARTNRLLETLASVSSQAASTVSKLEARLLDKGGLSDDAQAVMKELAGALADARATLKRADGILSDAQKITANTAAATEDLVSLRGEVEASLRRLSGLIDEINRRWPFARESGLKLP